jgi:hypothetical protein
MPTNATFLAVASALCLYFVVVKMRIAQVSGFRLFRWTGLATGAIFFLLFFSLVLPESLDKRPLITGLVAALMLAQISEIWQEERLRKTFPSEWQAWKELEKQAGWWGRLRLYPGAPARPPVK